MILPFSSHPPQVGKHWVFSLTIKSGAKINSFEYRALCQHHALFCFFPFSELSATSNTARNFIPFILKMLEQLTRGRQNMTSLQK